MNIKLDQKEVKLENMIMRVTKIWLWPENATPFLAVLTTKAIRMTCNEPIININLLS